MSFRHFVEVGPQREAYLVNQWRTNDSVSDG